MKNKEAVNWVVIRPTTVFGDSGNTLVLAIKTIADNGIVLYMVDIAFNRARLTQYFTEEECVEIMEIKELEK